MLLKKKSINRLLVPEKIFFYTSEAQSNVSYYTTVSASAE